MSRIVLPSSRSERIVSHAVRRAAGSKPVVGSSRKISSGSPTSASPKSSRRRCPPESFRTTRSAFSSQADDVDHLVDRPRVLVVAAEEREALARGEVLVHRRRLQHDADARAPVARRAGGIGAEHRHGASVAASVALEDLDRRRLAGAVRAEQREDLSLADLEAHASQRLVPAVALAGGPRRRRRSQLELADAARGELRRGAAVDRGDDLPAVGLVPDDHDRLAAPGDDGANVVRGRARRQALVLLGLDADRRRDRLRRLRARGAAGSRSRRPA